jgi:hypothetical protein
MRTINTRDLAHGTKKIRKILSGGETLQWASRGEVIALIHPVRKSATLSDRDWLARATKVGAVNQGTTSVSQAIADDRG